MFKRRLVRSTVLAAATAAMAAMTGCATSRAMMDAEMARSNTQTVLAFEETVFNKHQVKEGFRRYVGSLYKQHDPLLPDGKEAAIKALNQLLIGEIPNSHLIVKRTVAQGDLVAVHSWWDRKPGESRGVAVVDIYRLEGGKIAEHWSVIQDVPDKTENDNTLF